MNKMKAFKTKNPKIYVGETPVEELQARFTDEVKEMGKKAALELGCNVEQLKWQVNAAGLVHFEIMTADEQIALVTNEQQAKRVRDIKKSRGGLDG